MSRRPNGFTPRFLWDQLKSHGNLEVLLLTQEQPDDVEPYVRGALENGQRALGDDSGDMVIIWASNLDSFLEKQGKSTLRLTRVAGLWRRSCRQAWTAKTPRLGR